MALKKVKSEGGQGGKRGHSNMSHWFKTAQIKRAAKRGRRVDDRRTVREEIGIPAFLRSL